MDMVDKIKSVEEIVEEFASLFKGDANWFIKFDHQGVALCNWLRTTLTQRDQQLFNFIQDLRDDNREVKASHKKLVETIKKERAEKAQKNAEIEAAVEAERDRITTLLENLVPHDEDATDVINDWIIPELKRSITHTNPNKPTEV